MPSLDVHLVTPERQVWAGEASFVVVRSVEGDLGVLPEHAPTLAELAPGTVRIDAAGGRTEIQIDGGFLHVGPFQDGVTRVDILAEQVGL